MLWEFHIATNVNLRVSIIKALSSLTNSAAKHTKLQSNGYNNLTSPPKYMTLLEALQFQMLVTDGFLYFEVLYHFKATEREQMGLFHF